jgi:integrase/recombinase XerD
VKQLGTLTSSIGPQIARYIAFKRALGGKAIATAYILRRLDRFLTSCNGGDLTREAFAAWSISLEHLHPSSRSHWLWAVYRFCIFRRREDPEGFVPDPVQFPSQGPRHLPYIFSEDEITRLLAAANSLDPHKASPLHREVARIGIILLYTAGLRRGELARLTLGDYEAAEHALFVHRSKFEKSRLVPLSSDAACELDRYLAVRNKLGAPSDRGMMLLVHNHGERFRGYTRHATEKSDSPDWDSYVPRPVSTSARSSFHLCSSRSVAMVSCGDRCTSEAPCSGYLSGACLDRFDGILPDLPESDG